VDFFGNRHQAAGFDNSSSQPNAKFVEVGFCTVLDAKIDMKKGTEVFVMTTQSSRDLGL
jgi:hypothetical protein